MYSFVLLWLLWYELIELCLYQLHVLDTLNKTFYSKKECVMIQPRGKWPKISVETQFHTICICVWIDIYSRAVLSRNRKRGNLDFHFLRTVLPTAAPFLHSSIFRSCLLMCIIIFCQLHSSMKADLVFVCRYTM